jgi:D-glycero-alpha-D-manno-heptose 1-phosphate guanylyltransferase
MAFSRALTGVVLAGGKGTRIAGLYPDLPKPLIPARGEPFLYWVTAWLATQGVRDIVYSTGYLGEKIESWVGTLEESAELRLRCRREAKPLGTGGGIINCLDLCADAVLALNGDSMLVTDLGPCFAKFEEAGVDGVLLGLHVDDASRYGTMECDGPGFLRRFAEKRPGPGIINAGIYLMRRDLFDRFPRGEAVSMEYDVLPKLVEAGARLAVHVVAEAPFLDIGTPESVTLAEGFIGAHSDRFAFRLQHKM